MGRSIHFVLLSRVKLRSQLVQLLAVDDPLAVSAAQDRGDTSIPDAMCDPQQPGQQPGDEFFRHGFAFLDGGMTSIFTPTPYF
jgi:hypothetical protein